MTIALRYPYVSESAPDGPVDLRPTQNQACFVADVQSVRDQSHRLYGDTMEHRKNNTAVQATFRFQEATRFGCWRRVVSVQHVATYDRVERIAKYAIK